jgi:hypothetical protein
MEWRTAENHFKKCDTPRGLIDFVKTDFQLFKKTWVYIYGHKFQTTEIYPDNGTIDTGLKHTVQTDPWRSGAEAGLLKNNDVMGKM